MRWAVSLLLVSALLVQARPAGADASQEARTRFEKGTTLYDLGQYLDAAHEYEEAYKLRNSPPLLFNIGQAYRLAGEHAKALRAYRSYLRRVPDASNRAEVTGYIALCEKRASAEPAAKSADKPAPAEPATPPPSPRPAIA